MTTSGVDKAEGSTQKLEKDNAVERKGKNLCTKESEEGGEAAD